VRKQRINKFGQIAPIQEGEASIPRLQVRGGFMVAIGTTVAVALLLVFILKV